MRPAFFSHLLLGILFSLNVCDLRSEESWQDEARRKAESGDIKAQIALGRSLAGNGTEKDAEAEKWLRRAAEQGDAEAQRALGRFLIAINGRLREKFPNEGITWFEKAVAKGDGESCYFLHMEYKMMFSRSRWDNPNNPYPRALPSAEESAMFNKAIEWLNRGGEMLNPKCMMGLSRLYETGHVVSDVERQNLFGNTDGVVAISESKALAWRRKAADLGYGEALYLEGRDCMEGKQGAPDYRKALKLFKQAYDSPDRNWLVGFHGADDGLLEWIHEARRKAIRAKIDFSDVLPDEKYCAIVEARFVELETELRYDGTFTGDRFEVNRDAYEDLADAYFSGSPSARNEKRAFEVYMRLCEVCRYDRSIVPKVARIFLDKKPKDIDANRLVKILEDVVTRAKKEYTLGMCQLRAKEGDGAERKEMDRDWMTRQECLLALAKIYEGGIGMNADPVKSNHYYLECLLNEAQQRNLAAARSGDPKAQFRVGYILLDGTEDGAQRTISESAWRGDLFRTPGFIGWSFKHYCENGFLRSELKLDYSEARQRRNEAVKWITMAAEQGDLQAQAWLADIHSHYADFLNYELAFKWAQKAAVRGNAGALVVLSKLSLEGRGMPKDEIEAYAYMNMAASKDEAFRRYFTELESRLPANVRFMGQQRTKQLQKELEDEELRRVLSGDKDKVPKKGA